MRLAIIGGLALLPVVVQGQSQAGSQARSATPTGLERPSAGEWPQVGRDYYNQRYSHGAYGAAVGQCGTAAAYGASSYDGVNEDCFFQYNEGTFSLQDEVHMQWSNDVPSNPYVWYDHYSDIDAQCYQFQGDFTYHILMQDPSEGVIGSA